MNTNRRTQIVAMTFTIIAVAIGAFTIAVSDTVFPATQSNDKTTWIYIPISVFAVAFTIYAARESAKESSKEKERIAEAESKVETQPEKARPAWDLARVTLDSYFNRNLSQITYIFGLVCL